jgi:hypothetical protein
MVVGEPRDCLCSGVLRNAAERRGRKLIAVWHCDERGWREGPHRFEQSLIHTLTAVVIVNSHEIEQDDVMAHVHKRIEEVVVLIPEAI